MVVGKLDFTAVANESNADNTVLDELNAGTSALER